KSEGIWHQWRAGWSRPSLGFAALSTNLQERCDARAMCARFCRLVLIPGSFPPHPPSQKAMLLTYCCVERSASGNRAMASPGCSATNDGQPAGVPVVVDEMVEARLGEGASAALGAL